MSPSQDAPRPRSQRERSADASTRAKKQIKQLKQQQTNQKVNTTSAKKALLGELDEVIADSEDEAEVGSSSSKARRLSSAAEGKSSEPQQQSSDTLRNTSETFDGAQPSTEHDRARSTSDCAQPTSDVGSGKSVSSSPAPSQQTKHNPPDSSQQTGELTQVSSNQSKASSGGGGRTGSGRCCGSIVDSSLKFSSEESFDEFEAEEVKKLNDNKLANSLNKIHIEGGEGGERFTVRKGDVVMLSQAVDDDETTYKMPWLAIVQRIRALKDDTEVRSLEIVWLYSIESFRTSPLNTHSKWNSTLPSLGENEWVTVKDHTERVRDSRVKKAPVVVFKFDDRYPAATEPSATDADALEPVAHPLAFFNENSKEDIRVPDFFFGDQATEAGSTSADGEWGETAFQRLEFNLSPQEEEPKKSKKKKAKTPKSKKLQLNKLGFNEVYNPKEVQHFSTKDNTWFNTETLRKNESFKKMKAKSEVPPFDVGGDEPAGLIAHLALIASANIVRGGAFGLTGNAYLVTQADRISQSIENRQQKGKNLSASLTKAKSVARSFGEWQRLVAERARDTGMKNGQPPNGTVWVDPIDKKIEI